MPSPLSKRRRISDDGRSSPPRVAPQPSRPANVLPSFMTPTKASLAKSYPHLLPKSPARGARRVPSPIRRSPRRSIPPEGGLTEVVGVHEYERTRKLVDTANDEQDTRPTDTEESTEAGTTNKTPNLATEKDPQLPNEEETELRRAAMTRRLKQLRAECENLEQQLDLAKQSKQQSLEAQKKIQSNLEATIQSLLQSNDSSLSRQPEGEAAKPSLPTAAPKKLKNPLPLLRFIHPLTFHSTNSSLVLVDGELVRQYELKGVAMTRLYFDIAMSVNEKHERITNLQIKISPWAATELSPFLQKLQTSCNVQIALSAVSTYAKLATQRSITFARLAKDFVGLLPSPLSESINTVSRKGKEKEGDASLPINRTKNVFLGERSLSFQRGAVGLVVSWAISIDELGFAGSNVSISTKIPPICIYLVSCLIVGREVDDRRILDGLPGVFDSLVHRFGVERAVRTIIGIIFEEVA